MRLVNACVFIILALVAIALFVTERNWYAAAWAGNAALWAACYALELRRRA